MFNRCLACLPSHLASELTMNHRVHRVATVTFFRTFHHDRKIIPGWWGGGGARCTPTPCHSIYHQVQSCGLRSSWKGRYIPLFLPYPYMYSVVWPLVKWPLRLTFLCSTTKKKTIHLTSTMHKNTVVDPDPRRVGSASFCRMRTGIGIQGMPIRIGSR